MAYITDVVLSLSHIEEVGDGRSIPPVDSVNDWLMSEYQGQMRLVSKYAGGRARARSLLYMGAFNHLDHEGFMHHLSRQPWKLPKTIQVWMRAQNENVFTEWRLVGPVSGGPYKVSTWPDFNA